MYQKMAHEPRPHSAENGVGKMNQKKIIFQVTKIYMKKNRKRTLITFLGILVMVILMTAVFVGKDTVMEFMTSAVAADKGSWHVQVYGLDQEQVSEVKALNYIKELEVSRPLGYTLFPQSGNPDYTPFLEIKGYSGELFEWMNIHLKEGRYPEGENEILISERALTDGAQIKVGDTIEVDAFERYIHVYSKGEYGKMQNVTASESGNQTLEDHGFIVFGSGFSVAHGDTVKLPDHFPYFESNDEFEMIHQSTGFQGSFKVVGIMESPYYEEVGQGGYIALVKTNREVAAGEKVNVVCKMDLKKDADVSYDIHMIINGHRTPEEMQELKDNGSGIISKTGEHIPVESGRVVENDMLLFFAAKGSDGTMNLMMIFFQVFFIVLIMAASLVMIYNVFNISFRERCQYLGFLASVGATKSQKKWSVYYEIFSLLSVALPLGILLGIGVVKGGMMLLQPYFQTIINTIADNVVNGRSMEIGYHIIVRPMNLFCVVVFSVLAVWISAMLPAHRISKVGPIEGMRGSRKATRRKCRTKLAGLKKGHSENYMAVASVSRNRHSTKGIIRSIVAFMVLSFVTAYGMWMITDLMEQKINKENFKLGDAYYEYDYVFGLEDERYETYREEIMNSDEVSSYRELNYFMFGSYIGLKDLTPEYSEYLEKILCKYFPQGIPEDIRKSFLEPESLWENIKVNQVVLSNEDFAAVAKKAGLKLNGTEETPTAMVLDYVELSTDNVVVRYGGAVEPDYCLYQIRNPLQRKVGENLGLTCYDLEADTIINLPINFGGYVSNEAISDFYEFHDGNIWIILSEEADGKLAQYDRQGIGEKAMLFSTKEEDGKIVRKLSNLTNEYGESALHSAGIYTRMIDFKTAIKKIAKIVAGCFILLVALICLLNLYNSVMGRKIARQKELSVLQSIGMTKAQLGKMLFYENVRLYLMALVRAVVLSTGFVVVLYTVVSNRFGKLIFHMPVMSIVLILIASVMSLFLFTRICYGKESGKSVIEEVRRESI